MCTPYGTCADVIFVLTGTGVGKLLTLGGLGVWWIVDIVLLITGDLKPTEDKSWIPYY